MISRLLKKIGFFEALLAAFVLLDIQCPIKFLAKIPCPSCGTTHAIFALLRGNIKQYFVYQPMAVFLVIDIVLAFIAQEINNGLFRTVSYTFILITVIVNFMVWAIPIFL